MIMNGEQVTIRKEAVVVWVYTMASSFLLFLLRSVFTNNMLNKFMKNCMHIFIKYVNLIKFIL
jgi:hypothetical protein